MEKRSILWVDDDPDDLELMREVLKSAHYDFLVEEAHNGKEALALLQNKTRSQLPCLIILDMNMPVMDGREALKQIKEQPLLKQIPVVVFTTSSSVLDKAYCKRYETAMITKPFSYASLEEIVGKLLSHCKLN